ncbi:MAG: hypothetical protein LBP92_10445 [Deltaproteobacteria bacterium]|nr:hypothetical protein [Deltaproteobacteria bacterium]
MEPKPAEPTGQTRDEPDGPVPVTVPGSSEGVPVDVRGATLNVPAEPSPAEGQDASFPARGKNSLGVSGAVASPPAEGNSFGGLPAAPAGQVPSRDEVRALLRANPPASTSDLEAALSLLETAPGSEEQVFLVARVLAKRDPRYHYRLGLFFDPADDGPKGGVTPNVMYAYDEYKSAGDLPEAVANLRRLSGWVKANGATAKGVDGIEEFERVLSTD